MLETAAIMFIVTFILLAYMEYHFRQVPKKTREYLEAARRKNERSNQ